MAEIMITVTAEDNTQDAFRAIGEGARSAFSAIEAAAWDSGSLVASSFDTLKSKFAAVLELQSAGVDAVSTAAQQDLDTVAARVNSVFDALGSIREALGTLDAEIAKQRVIGIDTSGAVSAVKGLIDLIQSLPGAPAKAAPSSSTDAGSGSGCQPGPYSGDGGDGGDDAGYAAGTDYVPRTGFYKLHQGEAVIPASDNRGSASYSAPAGSGAQPHLSLTLAPGAIVINGADKSPEELARLIAKPIQKELEKLGVISGRRP